MLHVWLAIIMKIALIGWILGVALVCLAVYCITK